MKFCIAPHSDDAVYWGFGKKKYENDADCGCADFKFTLPSGEVIKLRTEYKSGSWETDYELPDGTTVDVDIEGYPYTDDEDE